VPEIPGMSPYTSSTITYNPEEEYRKKEAVKRE
jgi:hypothetical protein